MTADEALQDFDKQNFQQGLMHCFCLSLFTENKLDVNYEFSDGEKHCEQWLPKYLLSTYLVYCIPLAISMVNYVSKLIL